MKYKLEQRAKVVVTRKLDDVLIEILNENHWTKPMILIEKFLLEGELISGVLKELKAANISYVLNTEIIPEPPAEIIDQGAAIFCKNDCDAIIAIGGGSVIDTARGINIVRTNGGKILDYVEEKSIEALCRGLIAIPTTSGTGSELSNALVVTDIVHQKKLAILSEKAVSEYVVLDPELSKTMPKALTIQTGLDVFAHAAEAYTSKLSTPVIDAICEKIMFLVIKYLPKAVQNGEDLEARQRMMVAAALGGWVINNSGTHLGHSIGHVIGAKYHIPHGMACAYALPGVLYQIAFVEPEKIKEIGNILNVWSDEENLDHKIIGEKVSLGYKNFRDEILGLKNFEELGIKRSQLLESVKEVVEERFAVNAPFEVTDEIVSSILEIYG